MKLALCPAPNWGKKHYLRTLVGLDTIMFHRIKVGDGTAQGVIDFFTAEGVKWIGTTDMPYTFIVPADGDTVYQCVDLMTRTPHAAPWNTRSVGIGVFGDFRVDKPTAFQHDACVWLAQRIYDTLRTQHDRDAEPPLVTVHGAIPECCAKAPTKQIGRVDECPGRLFHPTWNDARAMINKGGAIHW